MKYLSFSANKIKTMMRERYVSKGCFPEIAINSSGEKNVPRALNFCNLCCPALVYAFQLKKATLGLSWDAKKNTNLGSRCQQMSR